MPLTNQPLERQRERRVRARLSRRAIRSLRARVGSLRRLLALSVLLILAGLGTTAYFALHTAPAPDGTEAILLGRGQAGVLGKALATGSPAASGRASGRPDKPEQATRGASAGGGEASYYGEELRGEPTASGERFNPEGYTAAHRTLPLGTRLRVTNVNNGQSVIVRVNDRGPFVRHRVIDVSKGAARALGMLGRGTAQVRLEMIRA